MTDFGGSRAGEKTRAGGNMKQPSLVIVEDEMLLALVLTDIAEELGYQVLATANTELGAVETVLARRPDVVLMDIHLARGNGLSAASAIRKSSRVPIVFCTAYAGNIKVQAAVQELGSTAMIDKPIDEAKLADMLASAVRCSTGAPAMPSSTATASCGLTR
jgi:CheY-like chemotaxis protein